MNMIVNRWFFPVISAGMLGAFYIANETSISPIGLILATILTFIGVGVIERLDKIIEHKIDNETLLSSFEESIDVSIQPLNQRVSDLEKASIKAKGVNWI